MLWSCRISSRKAIPNSWDWPARRFVSSSFATGRTSGSCQFTFQVHTTSRQMLCRIWARQNEWLLYPVSSSWGTPVINVFATFANRKLPVFVSTFPDQRAKYINAMPVPLSRMGMVYALPPFKMLPAVLSKIHSSHDLSVIFVALHLMAASWMPELLKQPRCLPIPLEGHPLLIQ